MKAIYNYKTKRKSTIIPTYIEVELKKTNSQHSRNEIYKIALHINADAVIHYDPSTRVHDACYGHARGTLKIRNAK